MSDSTIVEQEVEIRTPDGVADAVLYHHAEAGRPAVVHYPDGIGTRPSQRDMARRVASWGYNVLLPNIYYRTRRAPFFEGKFDFANEQTRARFAELTGPVGPDAMERDGSAYVDYLTSVEGVSSEAMGTVGFCFTGAFALRTAATRPEKIAAAASFHGGRLFRDDPNSHHLVLPRVRAQLYFGHARDDGGMPAEAITRFEAALGTWGGKYESRTYDALHGWTVPDSAAYNENEAERAMEKLRELFAAALR